MHWAWEYNNAEVQFVVFTKALKLSKVSSAGLCWQLKRNIFEQVTQKIVQCLFNYTTNYYYTTNIDIWTLIPPTLIPTLLDFCSLIACTVYYVFECNSINILAIFKSA